MGSSTGHFGPISLTVKGIEMPTIRPEADVGDSWVRMRQTAGGRTAFPLPRHRAAAPFVRFQSPIVWTTLELILHADGSARGMLIGASPFPRHWVYDAEDALTVKSGTADWANWLTQESWHQTPWGDQDAAAIVTPAASELERDLSDVIMHGTHRPVIRRVVPDEIVLAEGVPGTTIALILDGVFAVSALGEQIAEIGPGVVIGEGATIGPGLRRATVIAKTNGTLAQVPAADVSGDALRDLADQHRLDELPERRSQDRGSNEPAAAGDQPPGAGLGRSG